MHYKNLTFFSMKDSFFAGIFFKGEGSWCDKKHKRNRNIQVSRRHVLRKVVWCVKFIFGLDTDVARVRDEASNTSFHLAAFPRRGYHVCILSASNNSQLATP